MIAWSFDSHHCALPQESRQRPGGDLHRVVGEAEADADVEDGDV